MPVNGQPSSSTAASGAQQSSFHLRPVFEYTKKKKWADQIISELPGTVVLILDTAHVVMYAGPAVPEVIGWLPHDLVDKDVLNIVNNDDHITFCEAFDATVESNISLSCYVRLKCKDAPDVQFIDNSTSSRPTTTSSDDVPDSPTPAKGKELLFEVRGNPIFDPPLDDDEQLDIDSSISHKERGCKFVIIMAKPYPSRNMAIFNTFLELKMENERLAQRRDMLRAEVSQRSPKLVSESQQNKTYGYEFPASERCILDPRTATRDRTYSAQLSLFAPSTYSVSGSPVTPIGPPIPSPTTSSFEGRQIKFMNDSGAGKTNAIEEDDEARRKRSRRSGHAAKHVCTTCGRTDSPEWRKGPEGPKTLCNACGLRWAKKGKRDEGKKDSEEFMNPLPLTSYLGSSMANDGGPSPTALGFPSSGLSVFPTASPSTRAGWTPGTGSVARQNIRPAQMGQDYTRGMTSNPHHATEEQILLHPIPRHRPSSSNHNNNRFQGQGESRHNERNAQSSASELDNWNRMNAFRR